MLCVGALVSLVFEPTSAALLLASFVVHGARVRRWEWLLSFPFCAYTPQSKSVRLSLLHLLVVGVCIQAKVRLGRLSPAVIWLSSYVGLVVLESH
jgi:hypothetical protein